MIKYEELDLKEIEKIEGKQHICLWQTSPKPSKIWPKKYKPSQSWYVTFHCVEFEKGKKIYVQINLSKWDIYQKAYSLALKWGKKLNLPVLKGGMTLIARPNKKTTPEQQKEYLKIYKLTRT